jgi:hypothetical protein
MLAIWVLVGWVVGRVSGRRGPIEPPSALLTAAQAVLAVAGVAAVATVQLLA